MNKDVEIPNQPMCKNPNCTELADVRDNIAWKGYCSCDCMMECEDG